MEMSSKRDSKNQARGCDSVIVRQGIKNECHHHVQESRTFCKARAKGVLMITPRRRCLTEERREFIFGHSPQTPTTRVVRLLYPWNV